MAIRPPHLDSKVSSDMVQDVISKMKIPVSSVEGAVSSVNGKTGAVSITASDMNAQEKSELLTSLSSMGTPLDGMLSMQGGHFVMTPASDFVRSLFISPTDINFRGRLGLGSSAVLDVNVPYGIPQLDDSGKIPQSLLDLPEGTVNQPVSYNDLKDLPVLFDGDYNSLTNKPSPTEIPPINYPVTSVNDLQGDVVITTDLLGAAEKIHKHSVSDIQNLQSELDSKLGSGSDIDYSQIINSPDIPTDTADLTNSAGFITAIDIPAVVEAPVLSVNNKTGTVSLTAADVGAASVQHNHVMNDITGLTSALDAKLGNQEQIPYSRITGSPAIPAAQVQSDWNQSNVSSPDYIKNKPVIPSMPAINYPVLSVNGKNGTITLTPQDIGAAPANHNHAITEINGLQSALDGKISAGSAIPYSSLTGAPAIPTNTSQLVNGAGFLTSAPVTSVNSKTGAVSLTAADLGAATSAQGTKYVRSTGVQASGVKVKYYTVTSDTNGAWTLSLGTDFTEIFDVQAQAVSTAGLTGVRQSTVNAFTSTATTITGMTWGNTVIVTILLSGTNSLSLTPNTPVRVRVEGIGA